MGDLCDNIGLVGVSAMWSYVTASPSHHDQAIPILSPLLFMHVGHPYIPLFKIRRIFDLLVILLSCTGNPSESSSRTLKLVAKAVQNLANLVEFKTKEPFMTSLNPFIIRHMPDMIKFIDTLSVSYLYTVVQCTKFLYMYVQSNLRRKDILGAGLLSFDRRLSLSRRFTHISITSFNVKKKLMVRLRVTVFLFIRCFIHSRLALSQALCLLRRSSLTSVVLDVLVIHMYTLYMHTLRGLHAL